MIFQYVRKTLTTLFFFSGTLMMITTAQGAVREYWIAAEKMPWNYAPSGLLELRFGTVDGCNAKPVWQRRNRKEERIQDESRSAKGSRAKLRLCDCGNRRSE